MFGKKAKKIEDGRTKAENRPGDEATVHAMPGRFIASQPSAGKARGTGIMILLAGGVILAVAGIFLYFYYTSPDKLLETESGADVSGGVTAEESRPGADTIPAPVDAVDTIIGGPGADTAAAGGKEDAAAEPETGGGEAAAGTEPATADDIPDETGGGREAATGTPAETVSAPAVTEYKKAIDSDGDGLSDAEEAILGTDRNAIDSDGDGYTDLVEAMNLYNPAGEGGLLVNDNIEQYVSGSYGYRVLYPRAWIAEEITGGDSVMFAAGNNQFMQIIVQPNPEKRPVEEWYREQTGVAFLKSEQTIYKNGWLGVRSEDGLTSYLTKPGGENIFVVAYSPGAGDILSYGNIYAIMVRSLEISE